MTFFGLKGTKESDAKTKIGISLKVLVEERPKQHAKQLNTNDLGQRKVAVPFSTKSLDDVAELI